MSAVLSARQEKILKGVVEAHIGSAQPVGSLQVLASSGLDCSPATVRNEMAELMAAGYVEQPHTSAGRIPTDKGYRYYVDRLMAVPESSARAREAISRRLCRLEGWVEAVCRETCRMLLDATGQATIVVAWTASDVLVGQVHMARMGPRTLVVILVLSSGQVLHRSLEEERPLSASEVARCARAVRGALVGRPLGAVKEVLSSLSRHQLLSARERQVFQSLASPSQVPEVVEQVFLEGASRIAEAPEFRRSAELAGLLSLLDENQRLGRTVLAVSGGREFVVSIGRENPAQEMHQCSLVLRSVPIREEPPTRATLGVLGPRRMDYPHIAGALRDLARELPRWLRSL